jgi:hypothetical protein
VSNRPREQLPASISQLQQRLNQQFGPWVPDFTQIDLSQLIGAQAGGNGQSAGASSSSLVSVPVRIGSIFFDIILVVFVSIYWLLVMPAMSRFILSLFPEERQLRRRCISSPGKLLRLLCGAGRGRHRKLNLFSDTLRCRQTAFDFAVVGVGVVFYKPMTVPVP